MNKCICDFCEKKEALKRYKVYEDNLLSSLFDHYHSVDICKDCYEKLFKQKGKSDK